MQIMFAITFGGVIALVLILWIIFELIKEKIRKEDYSEFIPIEDVKI